MTPHFHSVLNYGVQMILELLDNSIETRIRDDRFEIYREAEESFLAWSVSVQKHEECMAKADDKPITSINCDNTEHSAIKSYIHAKIRWLKYKSIYSNNRSLDGHSICMDSSVFLEIEDAYLFARERYKKINKDNQVGCSDLKCYFNNCLTRQSIENAITRFFNGRYGKYRYSR